MNKRIPMIEELDGKRKVVCPSCKKYEMVYRDLGVTSQIYGGVLTEQDHGGFWECSDTKCGYQSEE